MRFLGIAVALLLTSGCATGRVVHLEIGHGTTIIHKPIDSEQITLGEREFKSTVTQFVLDMKLNVEFQVAGRYDDRSLLATTRGVVNGVRARRTSQRDERICRRQINPDDCLRLLSGGLALEPEGRRMMALGFALDTVWEGIKDAVQDVADPAALRTMVLSMIGTSLVMLVAPEPITKLIAIVFTASLIAYLGTGPVWNLGQGFRRLMNESKNARSYSELEDSGHRFGKLLGANGARVLIIAALTALGGKSAMAAQGSKLPGAAQAAMRLQAEGGFQFSAVLSGEVRSIALPSVGVLNVVLAPTAVAAIAMGPGNAIQGDANGPVHHICTDKNEVSDTSGGPWTPRYETLFKEAELLLNDDANKIRIWGHKGPHPRQYHEIVFERISTAMRGCVGAAQCRAALLQELWSIAQELSTEGSELRALVTKGAGLTEER